MNLPFYKAVAPAFRGLHTRAVAPRPQRCFHQTTFASLPRKRDFFTSNRLLANDGKPEPLEPAINTTKPSETQRQLKVSASTKRKPARAAAAAKSLRLGSVTKQPKRGNGAGKTAVPEGLEHDETDYHRTVRAICVAQSFDMEEVQEILRFHAFELDPDKTEFDSRAVVHARGVNNGDIFVFPSGTVVAWSVPQETLVTLATKQLRTAARYPHFDRREMEQLEFVPDETRETSHMKGEVIVLGTRAQEKENDRLDTTLAKIAFSSGLARSPKLAVLETNLEDYFQDSRTTLDVLAADSKHKLKRNSVIKMTGQLLSLRSQLNHYSDITEDLPDMFWDSESILEDYYNQIGAVLSVRQRSASLNKRIDYAHENVSVLREMVSEKYGHRLEWIIIWLITVEVMFELRRVYREDISEVATS
ncbi:Uu.00g146280.m01.CDS01 [Anthostomella pinea]|uniref:Uu.00g146280.m01.CDS01 n=1 Tax=Anthostomella pinea TaxID=933095 RepID=A0AAI8YLX1_9PEZI|nr:Uu.00g146280.m01.CDS01 [Anthostomella pinea]